MSLGGQVLRLLDLLVIAAEWRGSKFQTSFIENYCVMVNFQIAHQTAVENGTGR